MWIYKAAHEVELNNHHHFYVIFCFFQYISNYNKNTWFEMKTQNLNTIWFAYVSKLQEAEIVKKVASFSGMEQAKSKGKWDEEFGYMLKVTV